MFSRRVLLVISLAMLPAALHAATLNNASTVAPVVSAPDVPPAPASAAASPTAPAPQPSSPSAATAAPASLPSGIYQLDPNHASVTFKISHLGFSHYTGRFDKMEAVLSLNAKSPADSSIEATVYPTSIDTNNPKLEEDLRGDKWLNVIAEPRASFVSNKIEMTGPSSAKVTGEFTFKGETHPLTLDVTLVGQGSNTFEGGKPTIGFSATGSFKRSDYGLTNLLPMVGDDVTLQIEAEFDKEE